MKTIQGILAALALTFVASAAQAEVQAPYTCNLTFQAEGGGFKFLVGHFELNGPGQVTCWDLNGAKKQIPVQVRLGGQPFSLSAGVGMMKIAGVATGIGLAAGPQELLGGYLVASVQGAVGAGLGANLALHAAEKALTLNLGVQAVGGFGANVGFDYVEILPAN